MRYCKKYFKGRTDIYNNDYWGGQWVKMDDEKKHLELLPIKFDTLTILVCG